MKTYAIVGCLLASGVFGFPGFASTRRVHVPTRIERRQAPGNATEVCTTEKCKVYAKHILQSLAPNYTAINPCVDFDRYACDGWRNTHQYRPEQAALSVSSVMSDVIRDMLHDILTGNMTITSRNSYDALNFDKMKMAFDTCMNEPAIKSYGVDPIKKLLAEFETKFPASGYTTDFELTDAITWLYKKGGGGFVGASPTVDDMSPEVVVIGLGGADLPLAKQYYTKPAVLANYTKEIAEMYQVLASEKPIDDAPIPASTNASLYAKATRIVDFETKLSNITADPDLQSKIEYYYTLRTLNEVGTLVPEVAWMRYLGALIPPGYNLSLEQKVIVGDIYYMGNVSAVLQATPRETMHDFLEWKLISSWAGRLHSNFSAPMRRFSNIMAGRDPNAISDRYRTCVRQVDNHLGHLLGSIFISKAFSKKDKALGDQIILDVKAVFAENLKNLDWMSEPAKKVAAEKANNLVQKVGYQTKNPNEEVPQELYDYYLNLPITTNYFTNGVSSYNFGLNKTWYELLKPTDKDQWGMTSPTVNAYYNPPLNEIVFPAGIMQTPNFSGDLPDYVSYGAFGATAGHELTHGFDDNGSKYDARGVYREWWDADTTKKFTEKSQCFIKQYAQYTVEGLDGEKVPINGLLTLGENIADSGGLNAAYRAWKKREAVTPNPALPGLEHFTNDQLFFISYGNSWCEKIRKEALLQQVYSDPHSPADKRVIGPLDNSPEFKQVFNCPVKKAACELW